MRFPHRSPTPLPARPHCDEVRAVLQTYIDGELGPEDTERVAEHLEHCRRCEIETETVEAVVRAIRRQRPELEADALARLRGFVDDLTEQSPPGR